MTNNEFAEGIINQLESYLKYLPDPSVSDGLRGNREGVEYAIKVIKSHMEDD